MSHPAAYSVQPMDSLTFYNGARDEPIPVEDVFTRMYGELENLIAFNLRTRNYIGHISSVHPLKQKTLAKLEEKKMRAWRMGVPDIVAVAETPTGERTYQVRERADLEFMNHPNPEKRYRRFRQPNILYLQDIESNEYLVLRAARTYDPNIVHLAAGDTHHNSLNPDWLTSWSRPKGVSVRKGITAGNKLPRHMLYVPEPHLMYALERLHQEEGIPRIAPRAHLLAVNARRQEAYFIRPFLHQVRDGPVAFDKLADFAGWMGALGLLELDRNLDHYCWLPSPDGGVGQQVVVNIDPDVYLHVRRKHGILDSDFYPHTRRRASTTPEGWPSFMDIWPSADPQSIDMVDAMNRRRVAIMRQNRHLREAVPDLIPKSVKALTNVFPRIGKEK